MQRIFNPIALKEWRHERVFSGTELAGMVNISQGHYSDIERGKKNPSPRVARALADALQIDVRALFFAVPPQPSNRGVRVG